MCGITIAGLLTDSENNRCAAFLTSTQALPLARFARICYTNRAARPGVS